MRENECFPFSKAKHFSSKRYFQAPLSKLLQNKFFSAPNSHPKFSFQLSPNIPQEKKKYQRSRGCSFTPYILFEQILWTTIIISPDFSSPKDDDQDEAQGTPPDGTAGVLTSHRLTPDNGVTGSGKTLPFSQIKNKKIKHGEIFKLLRYSYPIFRNSPYEKQASPIFEQAIGGWQYGEEARKKKCNQKRARSQLLFKVTFSRGQDRDETPVL